MGGQNESCAQTAILAYQLGEYDGIQSAGHTGDDDGKEKHFIQSQKLADPKGRQWDQYQTEQREQIQTFPFQEFFDGESGKADTYQQHTQGAYTAGSGGENTADRSGELQTADAENGAQQNGAGHGIDHFFPRKAVPRQQNKADAVGVNNHRDAKEDLSRKRFRAEAFLNEYVPHIGVIANRDGILIHSFLVRVFCQQLGKGQGKEHQKHEKAKSDERELPVFL